MQAPIFESLQLEGSYVGDLLYIFFSDLCLLINRMRCFRVISESRMPNHAGLNLSTDLYHLHPTESGTSWVIQQMCLRLACNDATCLSFPI